MPAGENPFAQRAFVEALVEAGGGILGGDRRQERRIEPGGDPVGPLSSLKDVSDKMIIFCLWLGLKRVTGADFGAGGLCWNGRDEAFEGRETWTRDSEACAEVVEE